MADRILFELAPPEHSSSPSDLRAPRFPVSVKGVVFIAERVVLLKNEREEWELPGGKLEPGEDPIPCLAREIQEELALDVDVGAILDCWRYRILERAEVVVVTYGCHVTGSPTIALSHEHKAVGLFSVDELAALSMPEGYRRSIHQWAHLRGVH